MKPLYFVIFLVFFSACSRYQTIMKEAHKLEEGGLKREAFDKYAVAYRDYKKADSRVGMKRTAQLMLDEKFLNARMECMRGNYTSALSQFELAYSYYFQLPDLELKLPLSANQDQLSCKDEYINHLYQEAEKAVLEERFDQAKSVIANLLSVDRNHQKGQYLLLLCDIIPNYNLGKKAYDLKLYRQAYGYFLEVTKLDASYKDAMLLRDDCVEKLKVTLAVVRTVNHQLPEDVQQEITSSVKNKILAQKDPFIQLVERENLSELLDEQAKGMTGLVDENTAIKAGELTGARYIVICELVTYRHDPPRKKVIEKKGFLGSSASYSKKVRYEEIHFSRSIEATFRYRIVDAESGQVFASESIPYVAEDAAVSAQFEGDTSQLYPGEWKWQLMDSREDVVYKDKKELLDQYFKNQQKGVLSESEMRISMANAFGQKVGEAVKQFDPKK